MVSLIQRLHLKRLIGRMMSEPIDTSTWSTPISAMVPQKLKQKIWEDVFIDLAVLLPNNLVPGSESSNNTFKLEKNDSISLIPKKAKQSLTPLFNRRQFSCALLPYMLRNFQMQHQIS